MGVFVGLSPMARSVPAPSNKVSRPRSGGGFEEVSDGLNGDASGGGMVFDEQEEGERAFYIGFLLTDLLPIRFDRNPETATDEPEYYSAAKKNARHIRGTFL